MTIAGPMPDIRNAVRPVFFETPYEEWQYATGGGTLFLIEYRGRPYGLTCKHVFKDFEFDDLRVSSTPLPLKGTRPASFRRLAHIDSPDEVGDLALIEFADDVSLEFFGGTAYPLADGTYQTSDTAHVLRVWGLLKDQTRIDYDTRSIHAAYAALEFREIGQTSADPMIREAVATYSGHGFDRLTGISGAPVWDETTGKLCGMAMRGGLDDGVARLWYGDIAYIIAFVHKATGLRRAPFAAAAC